MSPPDEVLKLDVSINGRNANTVINDSKKLQLDMLNKMVAEKNKDYNPKQGGTFYFLVDPSQIHTINGDNVKIETSYSISSTFKFVDIPMDISTIPKQPVEDISFAQAFPAPKPVVETVKPQSLPSQSPPPTQPSTPKPPLKSTGKRRKLFIGDTIKENIYYLNKGRISKS